MKTKAAVQESPEKEYRLLSPEERAILSRIVAKEPPYSQRAQALLALDEGTTQAEAGRQAGLTIGQARYWLTKFDRDRMGIFPDELLNQAQLVDADSPRSSAKQTALPDVQDIEQPESEEEAQPEKLDAEETTGSADAAEDTPEAKKKSKTKSKPVTKKKPKKAKKAVKEKKPKKKTKKNKSKKAKAKKSKPGKKKRKK